MLRQIPRRSLQLMRRVRHLSSSPDAQPPYRNFYGDLSQYLKRVLDRKDQLKRYLDHCVFPPSNWTLRNYYLYAQLQLPPKTEIDAVEFLDGARFACDRILRAMHSPELIDFATANAPFNSPAIADEMEQMFESTCHQGQLLPCTRRLGLGVPSQELKELDFTNVYLSGVKLDRPTRAYLKTEEKLRAVALQAIAEQQHKLRQMSERPNIMEMMSDLSSIKKKMASVEMEPEDGSETLERLQLRALFRTTQTVEAVSAMTSERVAVKSDVKTTLCFESFVTNPEDVDWQIVQMNQFGRVVS
ncbi:hypothetical protein PI124_g18212 [Phytophthora idaei]|nr:hypothetical protein PI125_g18842 [Phytophthora idaei]KAG3136206.1 hypothetical protein PI126_g17916 [Phytophthora idaei]KAG3236784.1 hypothetical protein PI124_g18212 [Phytophthora idaei]